MPRRHVDRRDRHRVRAGDEMMDERLVHAERRIQSVRIAEAGHELREGALRDRAPRLLAMARRVEVREYGIGGELYYYVPRRETRRAERFQVEREARDGAIARELEHIVTEHGAGNSHHDVSFEA